MEIFKLLLAFPILLNLLFCFFFLCISHASDTLKQGEILSGSKTLVSSRGVFELGFFSSEEKQRQYLGIWFKNDKYKKAVWVGNQDYPLVENSALLYITDDGNLVVNDVRGLPTFLNNGMAAPSNNTICKLLDSGNLVLMEAEMRVWQSFDYPTDTFLPGMKLGFFNSNVVRKRFLVSWSDPLDPTKGIFVFGMNEKNRTRFNILRTTDSKSQEIGLWDGERFMFSFQTESKDYNFSFVSNKKETYLTFINNHNTDVPSSWFELTPNGEINEVTMVGEEILIVNHSTCGDGLAAVNSTECLTFSPSNCGTGDMFSEIKGVIPNSTTLILPARMGLTDCELTCQNNCSCAAYAPYGGDNSMCLLYYGENKDLKKSVRANQTIYVRGGFPTDSGSGNQSTRDLILKIALPVMSLIMFIVILFLCCLLRRRSSRIGIDISQSGLRRKVKLLSGFFGSNGTDGDKGRNTQEFSRENIHELPMLSFSCISDATDNFSFTNKVGEGGFGPVYKGKLFNKEVAIKRLSKSSGQGFEEFKNEVQLISELQHRNLVKLLGYCIHEEEKILVYEYMANKSLDSFIFDKKRRTLLNWGQRMHIIEGIAQGLLYMHKYSRLRVIHRDMKSSNILLDGYMNPKISDFGMARICQENESQGITRRVVGTYGYMSPEYAVHGHFSTKSDVFSYGVILLEIVSGKKNTTSFEYLNRSLSLLGYAWNLWKDDRAGELLDPTLADSCRVHELQLCIQVALLCIQEDPEERPAMSEVVSMLGNERTLLPDPSQPALSTYLNLADIDSPKRVKKPSQISVTISAVQAR